MLYVVVFILCYYCHLTLTYLTDFVGILPYRYSEYNYVYGLLNTINHHTERCKSHRFTLEYATPVSDPHLARDCDLLEKIQRRSARFVKGDHRTTSSVTHMLHDLGWRDLSDRRRDLRLALLYNVVTGHVAVSWGGFKMKGRTFFLA